MGDQGSLGGATGKVRSPALLHPPLPRHGRVPAKLVRFPRHRLPLHRQAVACRLAHLRRDVINPSPRSLPGPACSLNPAPPLSTSPTTFRRRYSALACARLRAGASALYMHRRLKPPGPLADLATSNIKTRACIRPPLPPTHPTTHPSSPCVARIASAWMADSPPHAPRAARPAGPFADDVAEPHPPPC